MEINPATELGGTTPDEKNTASATVCISQEEPTTGRSSPFWSIKWLATKAAKLQLAFTQPGAPAHFPEPSSDETAWDKFKIFLKFMGPGAVISVAYIDPDNFQTNIAAGASFQYKQLFMLLISVLIAVYLQVCMALVLASGCHISCLNRSLLLDFSILYLRPCVSPPRVRRSKFILTYRKRVPLTLCIFSAYA